MIKEHLSERGLRLSEEKTEITHIAEGFDFLGQNVRKYEGKLLIQPSKSNVKAFLHKVRTITKECRGHSAATLVRRLNPVIRDWANYHRHVASKGTFAAISGTRNEPSPRNSLNINRYFSPP